MDSSVAFGVSGAVDADCAITLRSLSIRKGRESPVEAALVPEHGLDLVGVNT